MRDSRCLSGSTTDARPRWRCVAKVYRVESINIPPGRSSDDESQKRREEKKKLYPGTHKFSPSIQVERFIVFDYLKFSLHRYDVLSLPNLHSQALSKKIHINFPNSPRWRRWCFRMLLATPQQQRHGAKWKKTFPLFSPTFLFYFMNNFFLKFERVWISFSHRAKSVRNILSCTGKETQWQKSI